MLDDFRLPFNKKDQKDNNNNNDNKKEEKNKESDANNMVLEISFQDKYCLNFEK